MRLQTIHMIWKWRLELCEYPDILLAAAPDMHLQASLQQKRYRERGAVRTFTWNPLENSCENHDIHPSFRNHDIESTHTDVRSPWREFMHARTVWSGCSTAFFRKNLQPAIRTTHMQPDQGLHTTKSFMKLFSMAPRSSPDLASTVVNFAEGHESQPT